MTKTERQLRHLANLARINSVQQLCGRADKTRIDREATVLERARLMGEELQAHEATENGLAAFDRLLGRIEDRSSQHHEDLLTFVRAIWNNEPMSLRTLRGLEQAEGNDVMAVLDAFRHARLSLVEQVDGGPARVARLLSARAVTASAGRG